MADPVLKSSIGSSGDVSTPASGHSPSSMDGVSFSGIVKDILLLESQRQDFFKDIQTALDISMYPIGTVKFQRVYSNIYANDFYEFATPKKIHNTIFPRKGEMVRIDFLETYDAQSEQGTMFRTYMYSDLISAWNNVEHNIIPKNSLFSLKKEQDGVSSYQTSQTGNVINKQDESPYSFKELGNIKGLYPMNDNVIQGRGGNTIRLGVSYGDIPELPWKGEEGNPLIVMRVGQSDNNNTQTSNVFENINQDGSSFYLLSKQKIGITVACDNFESFNVNIDNTVKNNIIVPKKAEVVNDQIETFEAPTTDLPPVTQSILDPQLPVSSSVQDDITSLEQADDSEYEIISVTEEIPVTNGIYRDIISKSSNDYNKYYGGLSSNSKAFTGQMSTVSKAISNADLCLGKVSPITGMSPSVKALLDVIAIMEGTAGYGSFNGYDVYYGYKKLLGYDSYDSNPIHPNIKIVFNKNGEVTTAAGRYQFNYPTWSYIMGQNVGMSKVNQDMAAWKRMKENVSQSTIDSIGESNFDTFKLVVGGSSTKKDPNCLAGIWASLPSSYGGASGFYGQNMTNQKSFENLFDIYKKAYQKYK